MWNLRNDTTGLIYKNRQQTHGLTDVENKLMVTKEELGGRDKLGVWD